MTFCFQQLLCLPFERFHLVFFLVKTKVYLQIFLCPDDAQYFSIPMSLIEGLDIHSSLSILPSTVLCEENFFFYKLSTIFQYPTLFDQEK